MIAIFADTHRTDGHGLVDEALTAAREADAVVHAGDFTTVAALDAFQDVAGRLYAVRGNADTTAVRDRLPDERIVEAEGLALAVTHRRHGGETGLATFGRAHEADVVVSGHTHRPAVVETDDVVLVNPGSHARPRGNRPGFAVLEREHDGVRGRLFEPDGTPIASFELA